MAIRSDTAGLEKSYLLDMLTEDAGCVLEIGCGDGRLIWQMAESAALIVGVDLPATLPSKETGARFESHQLCRRQRRSLALSPEQLCSGHIWLVLLMN